MAGNMLDQYVRWKNKRYPELRFLQDVFHCPDWQVNRVVSTKLQKTIAESLDKLPEPWATVIRMRYGFFDGQIHTYEEIGYMMGVTRSRTAQILKAGKERLDRTGNFERLRRFLLQGYNNVNG